MFFTTYFYKYFFNVHNDPCFEDKSSSITLIVRYTFPNKPVPAARS